MDSTSTRNFQPGDTVELKEFNPSNPSLKQGDRVKVKKIWQTSLSGSYGFDYKYNGRYGSSMCWRFKKVKVEPYRLPAWAIGSAVYATIIKIGLIWHFFNK